MNLNFLERLVEIKDFLQVYEEIYQIEFLKKYPAPYPDRIMPWIKEMRTWDNQKLSEFESSPSKEQVENPEFKDFLKKITELTQIPMREDLPTQLPKEITVGLSKKKAHELSLLKSFFDQSNKEVIVDIGGGVGHTSLTAVYKTEKTATCVDRDKELLIKGDIKLKSIPLINDHQVKFLNKHISFENYPTRDQESLTIGLHSCGDLSVEIINHNLKTNNELILFGCCYHKIIDGLYLSHGAKENKLKLSQNALHLASRSSKKVTALEIEKRKRFKRYRYTLHYFLNQNFHTPFSGIGNSGPRDYQLRFSEYVRKQKLEVDLSSVPDKELDEFYENKSTYQSFLDNFHADEIRLQLGRLVELYILLDRAIFLKENGHKVELYEVFDRKLSPRNIMIKTCP